MDGEYLRRSGSCLEMDDNDSCALSLDESPTEMLDEDDDVDKPYLPLLVPFTVTFVPALPLPVLLYADDETDLAGE